MKAVILAAGIGSRLGLSVPKALAKLTNDETILDYQVKKLSKFFPNENIYVVVGYKKEQIMKSHPELNYVYNEAYAETNTGKSLLEALSKIDDDVLWLNGDVVFDERIIPRLIKTGISCVLVDNKKCGPEEIKYNTDSEGYIKSISKQVSPAEGEALGINLVKRGELAILRKHLASIAMKDYFEKAIESMIKLENVKLLPVSTDGLFCMEVDFPEDLCCVREYLSESGTR